MALATFGHVKTKGISTVIPAKEICIYDEAQYYENSVKKIDRMRNIVGFYKRRVVEEGVTAADLCIQAAETLLQETGTDRQKIEALIFVVQRPDHSAPATAYYIHNRLGLEPSCLAFDIRQGCPGWVYGMYVASSMIESGAVRKVLLLAGDTPSAGVDPADRNVAPVFGDGGSATLLEYDEKGTISHFNITVRSDGYEAIIKPASGYRLPMHFDERDGELVAFRENSKGGRNRLVDLYMDGIAVFDFTMTCVPENIGELLDYAGMKRDDIDYLMLHQANKQIVQTVGMKAGFPEEKTPWRSFEQLGNQSITSIPISTAFNLADRLPQEKLRLLCSGFGNGLAVASAILEFDHVWCSGNREYRPDEVHLSREQYIEYWVRKIKGE